MRRPSWEASAAEWSAYLREHETDPRHEDIVASLKLEAAADDDIIEAEFAAALTSPLTASEARAVIAAIEGPAKKSRRALIEALRAPGASPGLMPILAEMIEFGAFSSARGRRKGEPPRAEVRLRVHVCSARLGLVYPAEPSSARTAKAQQIVAADLSLTSGKVQAIYASAAESRPERLALDPRLRLRMAIVEQLSVRK